MAGSRARSQMGVNVRQSDIFTEFALKDSFKLLDDI